MISYKTESVPHTRISSQAQIDALYEVGEMIGQGSFGKVFSVKEKSTGTQWAMKCILKVEKSLAMKLLEREIQILKRVEHEHIIKLKEVFETSDRVFLIMEFCKGGELTDVLTKVQKFSEADTKKIMSSLASAIAYLHKADIVHRDLKLSNILLSDNPYNHNDHLYIKVTDFGLSVIKGGVGHENMLNSFCGTLIYMAPEILENKTYSQQCDVWAMGVIAFQLLCGVPPFTADDEDKLMELIRRGEFEFFSPDWDGISSEAKSCIQSMLHLDTGYRLTAAEVLQHSWFTGIKEEDTVINVLEMMSSWKDDLIKEHLKEETTSTEESEEVLDKSSEPEPEPEPEPVKKQILTEKTGKEKSSKVENKQKTTTSSSSRPNESLDKSLPSKPNKSSQAKKKS